MSIIGHAVYRDGQRTETLASLDQTLTTLQKSGGIGWIGLYRPSPSEMRRVADGLRIQLSVVEATLAPHQRSKTERYADVLLTVLRPARYIDADERVEFGELHILTGANFVVTSRFAETPDLGEVRHRMEQNRDLLSMGPPAILYAIFAQVVDEYAPVVAGLETDIDEIEFQVFDGHPGVSRRIYQLLREVIDFQHATSPLHDMIGALVADRDHGNEELRRRLRGIDDQVIKVSERVDAFRALLENILTVNAALVGQRQNQEMQRLSQAALAQSEEVKKISS